MVTLSILVVSLATVGFDGQPVDTACSLYEDSFHFATASLYASDDLLPEAEPELPAPVSESESPLLEGNAYYAQGYSAANTHGDDANCRCRTPGFYLGGEATVLRPFISGVCIDPPCNISENDFISKSLPNYDTYVAPRLWLGYTSCDGLGCRVTWWRMDLNASGPAEFNRDLGGAGSIQFLGDVESGLAAETIDFEVTDWAIVGSKWDLMISGGVRYASFDWTRSADGTLTTQGITTRTEDRLSLREMNFEGVGGTAAVLLRRPWFHRVGLFANMRGSLLYGNVYGYTLEEIDRNGQIISNTQEGNAGGKVRSIWEAQLGVDWTKELWHGTYLTTRVAGEAQYWDSMISETDVGFVGMTFSVALIR